MCCFPSYNNIGFQPQNLKKAGVGFASGAEAIHGVAVPRRRQGFWTSKLLQGGLFSHGGFLSRIIQAGQAKGAREISAGFDKHSLGIN